MKRLSQTGWVVAMLLVLGGVVVASVTCDDGGSSDGTPPDSGEKAAEERRETSSASAGGQLPGDKAPGTLEPDSPGPEGAGLFFLAGLKGYLEPCGCSADVMLGGAERVVGYVRSARERYDGALMLDAGDAFFETTSIEDPLVEQERARADVVASMYDAMGTAAMVPGERDFALGAESYLELAGSTGAELLGANLEVAGESLSATAVREVGDWRVGLIGAVQPDLYEEINGVEAGEAEPAVADALEAWSGAQGGESVDVRVLVWHGGLRRAKELLRRYDALDFAVVGHDPREPGGADAVEANYTVEAFDQGRYVGVLKLFGADRRRPFANARPGSKADLEAIERKLEHVRDSLEEIPPPPPGEERPIIQRLRKRIDDLERRREAITSSDIEVPEDRRSFLFRPVAMRPGYPIAEPIQKRRVAYNRRLEELTKRADRSVPEVEEGEPTYVGTNQCTSCHGAAHEFWKGTKHARAMETLEERDKAWDEGCVKCHAVGYGKAGGSVVGKLEYERKVDGKTIEKNLRDVGCESCHGPGSKHMSQPVGSDGEPQFIDAGADRDVCMECHVPEHSPRFKYDSYVRTITGDGHELSAEAK